jgi:hypothetical protein
MKKEKKDVLSPSPQLLIKLGSALVHADEFLSPSGHPVDRNAFDTVMKDSEVKEWIKGMAKLALLPVKR